MSGNRFGLQVAVVVGLLCALPISTGSLFAAAAPHASVVVARAQAQVKPVDPGPSKGGGAATDAVPIACNALYSRTTSVPAYAINAALENPAGVGGWNQLSDPAKPASPYNTRRRSLTVLNPNKPFNALTNGVIFRSGCY